LRLELAALQVGTHFRNSIPHGQNLLDCFAALLL
jgi:hypothetical protein